MYGTTIQPSHPRSQQRQHWVCIVIYCVDTVSLQKKIKKNHWNNFVKLVHKRAQVEFLTIQYKTVGANFLTLSFKMLNLSVKNKVIALKRCNALTLQALTAHLWLFITLTSTSSFGFSFVPQSQQSGFRFTRFHHLILGSADTFTLHSTYDMGCQDVFAYLYVVYTPFFSWNVLYIWNTTPPAPPPYILVLIPSPVSGRGGGEVEGALKITPVLQSLLRLHLRIMEVEKLLTLQEGSVTDRR